MKTKEELIEEIISIESTLYEDILYDFTIEELSVMLEIVELKVELQDATQRDISCHNFREKWADLDDEYAEKLTKLVEKLETKEDNK